MHVVYTWKGRCASAALRVCMCTGVQGKQHACADLCMLGVCAHVYAGVGVCVRVHCTWCVCAHGHGGMDVYVHVCGHR